MSILRASRFDVGSRRGKHGNRADITFLGGLRAAAMVADHAPPADGPLMNAVGTF